MKTSCGPGKITSRLSEPVYQHLNRFGIATILIVGLLAFACPAAAEIVYTSANIHIGINSSYNLDLNNDGVADFTITTKSWSSCTGPNGRADETPASGNGAESSAWPTRLNKGDQIGSIQIFYGGTGTTAWETHIFDPIKGICHRLGNGNWLANPGGFLGLMFQVNGETHYGWARLRVNSNFSVSLTDYAYENTPGTPINAGQTPTGFTITTSPTSATVSPGQSTTSTLTLTPVAGFSGTVALTCTLPSGDGLSCGVSPSSVTLNGTDSATATLSINTSSSAAGGTYKIRARGAYGAIAHSTTFTLKVQ